MASIFESTGKAVRHGLGVVVAVVAGPEWPAVAAPKDLARWRRLTPSATWLCVNVTCADRSLTVKAIADMMERNSVRAGQLVLFGAGDVARSVLELVMQGELECAGVLAVDVSCAPLPFSTFAADAIVRLVVHQDHEEGLGLVDQLQSADIDERIIRLNPLGAAKSQATASAAEALLLELVAMVGHRPGI